MEDHHRYSIYQSSLLVKTFWYFLLNIIVMPGFAAAALSNIYDLITVGFTNRKTFFAQIFLFERGDFFVILVLQYTATSFFRQQTNFMDYIWSYFSPTLTRKFKQLTSNKENWMKHDYDVFTFGNNYAQNVVIFGIGIVFHATIPQVIPAIMTYMFFMYIADAYQILFWHRQEIESSGKLVGPSNKIETALQYIIIILILSQALVTLRTLLEGAFVPLIFMLVLLGFTITFFFVLAITPIINPEKFLDDRHELTPEVLSKWWDSYKHPLSVKSSITKLQSVEVNQCNHFLLVLLGNLMEVVHPKSSLKKLHHYDKSDKQVHARQNIFYNYAEPEREVTPTSSHKNFGDVHIPHRFHVNDLKVDVDKLLHGSDV